VCFLFVKIFCCYVYFVSKETRKRQHNDKECKFKEQRAKMWENIAGAKRYSRPRGFNIAGASASVAPAVPKPLVYYRRCLHSIRSRIFVLVGCPSVCLSVPSIDSNRGSGCFAAERGRLQQISYDCCTARGARAQQQMRVASCREPRDEARHRLRYRLACRRSRIRTDVTARTAVFVPVLARAEVAVLERPVFSMSPVTAPSVQARLLLANTWIYHSTRDYAIYCVYVTVRLLKC